MIPKIYLKWKYSVWTMLPINAKTFTSQHHDWCQLLLMLLQKANDLHTSKQMLQNGPVTNNKRQKSKIKPRLISHLLLSQPWVKVLQKENWRPVLCYCQSNNGHWFVSSLSPTSFRFSRIISLRTNKPQNSV